MHNSAVFQKSVCNTQVKRQEEFENILATQKDKPGRFTEKTLSILKKELGDFDISLG